MTPVPGRPSITYGDQELARSGSLAALRNCTMRATAKTMAIPAPDTAATSNATAVGALPCAPRKWIVERWVFWAMNMTSNANIKTAATTAVQLALIRVGVPCAASGAAFDAERASVGTVTQSFCGLAPVTETHLRNAGCCSRVFTEFLMVRDPFLDCIAPASVELLPAVEPVASCPFTAADGKTYQPENKEDDGDDPQNVKGEARPGHHKDH